jgi:hypothetical protein
MLDFCAAKDIYPDVEFIQMSQVNEAYERLLKNDVRYRFVIDMSQACERSGPSRSRRLQRAIGRRSSRARTARRDPTRRFWLDQAKRLDWNQSRAGRRLVVRRGRLSTSTGMPTGAQPVGQLPRPHLAEHGDRTAIIFEADEPARPRSPIASCTKRPAASRTC